jgi:Mg2+ and Co2+ transporter CorA
MSASWELPPQQRVARRFEAAVRDGSRPCAAAWPRRSGGGVPDVHDHLLLVNEEVAAQRDLLGTVLEANMAVISVEQTKVSVQQNSTIEQLTILATVFLPLTFVTGFFGQNFGWLVRREDSLAAFAIYGIGGLVVPLALLFVWLRRRAAHTGTVRAVHDNSSRTRSGRRSPWRTSPASHAASFSVSATVHSRKPRNLGTCAW